MDVEAILQQTKFENVMLEHIKSALRVVIEWRVQESEFSRKLSSLRFIAHSFQRHSERMMALEENDGYMVIVAESSPHLSEELQALQAQHEQLRQAIRQIMPRLDRLAPTDQVALSGICDDLLACLAKADQHSETELAFLREAFPAFPQ